MILKNGNNVIRIGNNVLNNSVSNFKNNCLWCFEMDQSQTDYLVDATGNYNNYFTLYNPGSNFTNSIQQPGKINYSIRTYRTAYDAGLGIIDIYKIINTTIDTNRSYSFWIKSNDFIQGGSNAYVFFKSNNESVSQPYPGFHFRFNEFTSKINIQYTSTVSTNNDFNINTGPTISQNTWYHIVIVFKNRTNNLDLYVNGVKYSYDGGSTYGDLNYYIQRYELGINRYNYDQFALFNYSLRDFDVLRLYNNGNGLAYTSW